MFQKDGGNHKPGPGRKKGVPNKWTGTTKDAIVEAFDRLGGVDGFVKWVNTSPKGKDIFYGNVWPKLLPLQMVGQDGGPLMLVSRVERVLVDPKSPD